MSKASALVALSLALLYLSATAPLAESFVRSNLCRHGDSCSLPVANPSSSQLWGIAEWRDLDFHLPGTDRQLGVQDCPPKSVCLLPFPFGEVLLQGETKQLRLYEERFVELFKDVMDNHEGVVAMGLIADSGIIQTVPLCEVEASNTMEGFGIFVTIRVVGRAQLLEITQQEPYLRGVCMEIIDVVPPNLELPNMVASNIEHCIESLSSMEKRLVAARKNKEIEDEEMDRRIARAKLEDRFYMDSDDEAGDQDEDDDNDDEESFGDRSGRFRQAYDVALATDTQGYRVTQDTGAKSARELTAVSWAAFCTDILSTEASTYRIQALDSDNLFERLKLASQMLREKKACLRVKMQNAGIKFRGEDLDEDEPTLDKN